MMNIYARYFDQDVLAHNLDELFKFLASISEIHLTPELEKDIRNYAESNTPYPKRYKVRPRIYFILIKTACKTLAEFKANRKQNSQDTPQRQEQRNEQVSKKDIRANQLNATQRGWYKANILFKRVVLIPGTSKFQYQDTLFSAAVLADSPLACYNRIIDHLKGRKDIDPRSQFPSARGQNFQYIFLGDKLPKELVPQKKEEEEKDKAVKKK